MNEMANKDSVTTIVITPLGVEVKRQLLTEIEHDKIEASLKDRKEPSHV